MIFQLQKWCHTNFNYCSSSPKYGIAVAKGIWLVFQVRYILTILLWSKVFAGLLEPAAVVRRIEIIPAFCFSLSAVSHGEAGHLQHGLHLLGHAWEGHPLPSRRPLQEQSPGRRAAVRPPVLAPGVCAGVYYSLTTAVWNSANCVV